MIDIVFEAGPADLRALVLEGDAVPSHRHRISATTAEHEVERGVDVTDHYRRGRDPVVLSVVISDAPLQGGGGTRRADAWQMLQDAVANAWPAIVNAGAAIGVVSDLYLTEATTEITVADRDRLRVELVFMPIRKVSTELVADVAPDRDRREVNEGSVSTTEAPDRLRSTAAAHGLTPAQMLRGRLR